MTNEIYVTKPFLPPLAEVTPHLERIWRTGVLTNNGPLQQELEQRLCGYLGVPFVSLFCNATVALMAAQKALALSGDFITTPYSFVATSHAFTWTGMKPIFVDVMPDCMTIDPDRIEEAITPQTTAIVAVHCYGNTCDTDAIQAIARKYSLSVIYDACHSFGVCDSGGSVLRYGDLSVVSLHATKVFNTFEGGLVVSTSADQKALIDNLKNFGFIHEALVENIGINGKFSELNAAVGLPQLDYVNEVIEMRGQREQLYREMLSDIDGISLFNPVRQTVRNYSYFPIFIGGKYKLSRDELYSELQSEGIFPRRYFYPLISEFPPYSDLQSSASENLPVATAISRQVLCLPLHPLLTDDEVRKVCNLIALMSK